MSDPRVTLKSLKKRGHKPSGWSPANRRNLPSVAPGEEPPRESLTRKRQEGWQSMAQNRKNSPKLLFSTKGVDFSDDASIEAFATRVWEAAAAAWNGGEMITLSSNGPSTVLTDRYVAAVAYATALHGTDVRKGTDVTYLCHLLGVSALVLEAGGTEDEAIAGLLHDAVEDAGGLPRLADVRARFGDIVAEIVLACSDSTDQAWKESVDYWERKQAYLQHLEDAHTDPRAVVVSIADKVHNARATVTDLHRTGVTVLDKFNTPDRTLILRYYAELLRIAKVREVPDTLTIPLEAAVTVIAEYVDGVGQHD